MTDQINSAVEAARENIRNLEPTVKGLDEVTKQLAPAPDQVRYNFATWIIVLFCLYAWLIAMVVVSTGDGPRANALLEIAKTILLPLVTLVLGHYFGSKSER